MMIIFLFLQWCASTATAESLPEVITATIAHHGIAPDSYRDFDGLFPTDFPSGDRFVAKATLSNDRGRELTHSNTRQLHALNSLND